MKPIELYKRKPESECYDLNYLRGNYYNHIPEVENTYFSDEVEKKNKRVKIKIIKDVRFDSRRFWRLATVWFDDEPVMIIQNAGREGDDHSARFVTNHKRYVKMISFIKTLHPENYNVDDMVDENQDLPELTNFYSTNLETMMQK